MDPAMCECAWLMIVVVCACRLGEEYGCVCVWGSGEVCVCVCVSRCNNLYYSFKKIQYVCLILVLMLLRLLRSQVSFFLLFFIFYIFYEL